MTVSPTLAINEEAARRHRAGIPTVPLGFGEAGVPVHPALADALSAAASLASYGSSAGIDALRSAAAGYWQRRNLPTDAGLVVAGPGSKALLYALLHTTRGAVALARPSWVSYAAQSSMLGLVKHLIPTPPGQGGIPDPGRLDDVATRARRAGWPITAVVVTLPDNPTGTLGSPATVAALCQVAERHDMLIISDEIYRDLIYDPATPFVSPAEIAPHRTVITSGLSKNLALGGWRIGVTRLPGNAFGRDLRDRILSIGSEIWSSPAQPVQTAAAWAFTEPQVLLERILISRALHRKIGDTIAEVFNAAGVFVPTPQAGFYLYPDLTRYRGRLQDRWSIRTSTDLADVLLHHHGIATLPGSAFGDDNRALTLRIATSQLYGSDDQQRETALHHRDPIALPWIAHHIERLQAALATLLMGP
ncbi:MAG: pyridoxal phosphate-dependent aminotransferase [Pseudonocardiaceae bacterium]